MSSIEQENTHEFNPDAKENMKYFASLQILMMKKFWGFDDISTEQEITWIETNSENFRKQIEQNPDILKAYIDGVVDSDQAKIDEAVDAIAERIYTHA